MPGQPDVGALLPHRFAIGGYCTANSCIARRGASGHDSNRKGQNMTVVHGKRTRASTAATRSGRLFLLELSGDCMHSMIPDGSDRKTIVTNCRLPDGIVVDAAEGHIYWTNMGI